MYDKILDRLNGIYKIDIREIGLNSDSVYLELLAIQSEISEAISFELIDHDNKDKLESILQELGFKLEVVELDEVISLILDELEEV